MSYPACTEPNCTNLITAGKAPCDYCRLWAKKNPGRPRPITNWIVNELGEFGIEIDGVPYFYYKWPDASPSAYEYRVIDKREFGETIKAQNFRGIHPPGVPARADSVVYATTEPVASPSSQSVPWEKKP